MDSDFHGKETRMIFHVISVFIIKQWICYQIDVNKNADYYVHVPSSSQWFWLSILRVAAILDIICTHIENRSRYTDFSINIFYMYECVLNTMCSTFNFVFDLHDISFIYIYIFHAVQCNLDIHELHRFAWLKHV